MTGIEVSPAWVVAALSVAAVAATWGWAAVLKRRVVRQQRDLLRTQHRFGALFDNLSDPVLIHDADSGDILSANAAARERYGFDAPELNEGIPLERLTDLSWEALLERLGASIHDGRIIFEVTHRDLQGERFPVEVHARLVEDADRTVLLAICRDITERRAVEEERLEHAMAMQRTQKLRAMGVLASRMAHDLNNLLTPILAYGDLLMLDLEDDPGLQSTARHIVEAAEEARDMVRRMATLGRHEPPDTRPVDLNELVQQSRALLREALREDIELIIEPSPLSSLVRADSGQLQQVMLQLVHNAQDAMPKGGRVVVETGDVLLQPGDVPALEPGRYVELVVRDSGEGMSHEAVERAFEPFFSTKGHQGHGLGLAVVFGVVVQHQGHVELHSSLGHGTAVHVYLPPCEPEGPQAPPDPTTAVSDLRGTETVLVVEDDHQVLTLARSALTRQGYTVLAAAEGSEALKLAQAHPGPIHVLLTDVVMPGLSGKRVYETLLEARPELRVLYMSGYTDDVIIQAGVDESAPVLLHKPFTSAALAAAMRRVLSAPEES